MNTLLLYYADADDLKFVAGEKAQLLAAAGVALIFMLRLVILGKLAAVDTFKNSGCFLDNHFAAFGNRPFGYHLEHRGAKTRDYAGQCTDTQRDFADPFAAVLFRYPYGGGKNLVHYAQLVHDVLLTGLGCLESLDVQRCENARIHSLKGNSVALAEGLAGFAAAAQLLVDDGLAVLHCDGEEIALLCADTAALALVHIDLSLEAGADQHGCADIVLSLKSRAAAGAAVADGV